MLRMTGFFGLCPSFGVLETRKLNVSKKRSVYVLEWGGGDVYSAGSLRKGIGLRLALSKGPNRVDVSPTHLRTEKKSTF
jgi:hypothetical protein